MRCLLLFYFAAVWLFAPCDPLLAQQPSGTPVHPFMKRVYDQIGQAWFRDVQAHRDMIPVGKVRIALTVSPEGKITKLRVVSNTSNGLLANISLRAIREAKIPRVPAELLTHGKLEDEISFEMRPN